MNKFRKKASFYFFLFFFFFFFFFFGLSDSPLFDPFAPEVCEEPSESSPAATLLEDDDDDAMEPPLLSDLFQGDEPLCKGSPITYKDAICCLFIFYLVSHLSKTAFDHLLQLLRLFLSSSGLPKNTDEFLRLFRGSDGKTRVHEYCEACQVAFTETDRKCPHCGAWRYQGGESDQHKKRKKAFFIELPIERDLQDLFKGDPPSALSPPFPPFLTHSFPLLSDPEFVKGLEYRRTRTYTNGVLEDIQDGKAYQDLLHPGGFLHDRPWNLVLGFNTDGVSPYKSSRFQMWPIFWQVHDLPPHLRFKPKYNRVCGLWFGKSKPRFNLFLQPFHSEVTRFYRGFSFLFSSFFSSFFFLIRNCAQM